MIKRFLIALFSIFFIMPAMANVIVTENAVREVVAKHIDADKQNAVVSAIVDKMKASNGAGLSVNDFLGVCNAAGWDISNAAEKKTCTNFVSALVTKSTFKIYHVCDPKVKLPSGAKGQCLEQFKSGIKVIPKNAPLLAKKLISKVAKDTALCSVKPENWKITSMKDDYVPCVSLTKNQYYEVRFDSVNESGDEARRNGVARAVCQGLYGVQYTAAGCTSTFGSTPSSMNTTCWNASCNTSDTNICSQINKDLSDFSFSAKMDGGTCKISFNQVSSAADLKNPFRDKNVDNFAFCRNIQVMGNMSLDDSIKEYLRSKGVTINSFKCSQGDVKYTGGGCTNKMGNSMTGDDILKCYVNGQEVDFVFDDLAESWKAYSRGGYQGISCIASDGSFDGKNCMGVNEQACNLVKQQSASTCPSCKQVYWDAANQLCILPSSASATQLQKGIQVAGTVVAVVAATAVTVFSGGTAAPGAWAVVAAVGSGLTIAGGTAVIASDVVTTYLIYTKDFQSDLNSCLISSDIQCAKDMLQKNLQKMVNYEKNLTDAEKKTLDESFAKLFKKIPAEDEFWRFLDDPKVWQCNSRGDCVVKKKTQLWQAIRTIGDISMIIGGVLKSFAVIASSMTKTSEVVVDVAQTRKARIVENPLKNVKSNLVKDVTYGNTNSLSIPNSFLQKGVTINGKTMTFARNSELAQYLIGQGYKVGDTVEIALEGIRQAVIIPTTTVSFANVVFNPAALASTVYGTGDLLIDGEMIPFVMRRPSGEEEPVEPGPVEPDPIKPDPIEPDPIIIPEPEPIEPDPIIVNPRPRPNNGVTPPIVTPEEPDIPEPVIVPSVPVTPEPVVTPNLHSRTTLSTGTVNWSSGSSGTSETKTKSSGISGLGAAAIGAGVVGVGIGAALLLGNDKDDKAATSTAPVQSGNIDVFNVARARANGIIGYVDNSSIELMPIETAAGTQEKIVAINGHAVVLVKHNNNKIPFMVDNTGGGAQWVPFIDVDMNTGTFRKYVPAADIMRTAKIAEQLAQVLPPLQMQYFAGPNSDGVQFAWPSEYGYKTINNNDLRYLAFEFKENRQFGGFFFTCV